MKKNPKTAYNHRNHCQLQGTFLRCPCYPRLNGWQPKKSLLGHRPILRNSLSQKIHMLASDLPYLFCLAFPQFILCTCFVSIVLYIRANLYFLWLFCNNYIAFIFVAQGPPKKTSFRTLSCHTSSRA